MKEGVHRFKYLKPFYVRVAFGIVELEIRPSEKSKVTVINKSIVKEWAIVAAQYVISTYYLPESIEVSR
jgi:hypothetical protein